MTLPINEVICGDCVEVMQALPDECVHTCVTSPPFWGLRDYGTDSWEGGNVSCDHVEPPRGGRNPETAMKRLSNAGTQKYKYPNTCGKCGAVRVDKQLGLEETPEEFVSNLVAVFREFRRILRKDGTLWLNMGDSYMSGGGASRHYGYTDPKYKEGRKVTHFEPQAYPHPVLKPKDLCLIPFQLALALQADGWWVRSDIIWAKPNPMPESVTDRPTKSYEHVFLLTRAKNYFYDAEAVMETAIEGTDLGILRSKKAADGQGPTDRNSIDKRLSENPNSRVGNPSSRRNLRDVWTIATEPQPAAHFACFPQKLVEPCIKAGTSERGVCAECGMQYVRIIKPSEEYSKLLGKGFHDHKLDKTMGMSQKRQVSCVSSEYKTIGWEKPCKCDTDETVPAIVYDPFMGSGTVAVVAKRLGRRFMGSELSQAYIDDIITPRLAQEVLEFR